MSKIEILTEKRMAELLAVKAPQSVLTTITPQMAEAILKIMAPNRNQRPGKLSQFADDIASGNWWINGDPIRFYTDGTMKDGQHRLTACIRTDKPIETFCVFGLDPASAKTVDTGSARKLSDVLGMMGKNHRTAVAAAINGLWILAAGKILTWNTLDYPSHAQSLAFLEENPKLLDSVQFIYEVQAQHILTPSIAIMCHFLFAKKDKGAADIFMTRLASGSELKEGDPVLLLRNWALNQRDTRKKHTRTQILATAIKAWNFHRSGTPIRYLRWRTEGPMQERFPEVL